MNILLGALNVGLAFCALIDQELMLFTDEVMASQNQLLCPKCSLCFARWTWYTSQTRRGTIRYVDVIRRCVFWNNYRRKAGLVFSTCQASHRLFRGKELSVCDKWYQSRILPVDGWFGINLWSTGSYKGKEWIARVKRARTTCISHLAPRMAMGA